MQDPDLTQIAIDKRLTLIAWEAMNHWTPSGDFMVHVFHMNNEMAGYCSVLHAMTLIGSTGHYGRHLRAVVIGFGNTARGAITGLQALGVHDITVLTMRDVTAVASPIPSVVIEHLDRTEQDPTRTAVLTPEGPMPAAAFLAQHDIVVNCVLQDTDAPLMFVSENELDALAPGSLLVDVSCDLGMGFDFARPTTFEEPMLTSATVWPTTAWTTAPATCGTAPRGASARRSSRSCARSWRARRPGRRDTTLSRAIEIRDGVVANPKILSFQGRSGEHPHHRF